MPEVFLEVPNSGRLDIRLKLHQGDEIVGEGKVGWGLRNDYEWDLDILRQIDDPTDTCLGCTGKECVEIV